MRTERMVWVAIFIGLGVWTYLILSWNPWSRRSRHESLSARTSADGDFKPKPIWTEIPDLEVLDTEDHGTVSMPDPQRFRDVATDPALALDDERISATPIRPQSGAAERDRMTVWMGGTHPRMPVRNPLPLTDCGNTHRGPAQIRPEIAQTPRKTEPLTRPAPVVQTYVVKKGDTLSGISQNVYGSYRHWKKILEANRDILRNEYSLRIGMKLTVPPVAPVPVRSAATGPSEEGPTVRGNLAKLSSRIAETIKSRTEQALSGPARAYTVARGDTLSSISRRFYGSPGNWKKIHEANTRAVPNANVLKPGTKLLIP